MAKRIVCIGALEVYALENEDGTIVGNVDLDQLQFYAIKGDQAARMPFEIEVQQDGGGPVLAVLARDMDYDKGSEDELMMIEAFGRAKGAVVNKPPYTPFTKVPRPKAKPKA